MPHEHLWSRRQVTLGLLTLGGAALSGCGTRDDLDSSDSSTSGRVRMVNATTLATPTEVYVDDVRQQSGLTRGSASTTLSLGSGSHQIGISNGNGVILNPLAYTASNGTATTLVAWTGVGGATSYLSVNDKEGAPPAGRAKLLVFNAARDAGKLDIYLTSPDTALASAARLMADVASGTGSTGYLTVNPGTLRLRLTAPGSQQDSDVRLDTMLTLGDQSVSALVITPGSGGVLASALLLQPDTAVTALDNTRARMRIVSGLPTSVPVTATFNGTTLSALGGSPAVGSYTLVNAGTAGPQVTVNGQAVSGLPWTAAAGSDTTLLVWGDSAAPKLSVFSDDNRLPGNASSARLRLVHGLADVSPNLSLRVGDAATLLSAAAGQSSASVILPASSATTLNVSNAASTAIVAQFTDKTLLTDGVYTVFLLGDSRAEVGSGLIATVYVER